MKQKRTHIQRYQWAVVDAIDGKLSDIAQQRNLLSRCGLDKEADTLNAKIVELNTRRKLLMEQIEHDRQRLALYIPKILLLCDLLAQVSSEFADEICSISRNEQKNNFSVLVDTNIEKTKDVMKQWEKAVLLLDELNDTPLSNHFAGISEQFAERVAKVLNDYLAEVSQSKEFRKFF